MMVRDFQHSNEHYVVASCASASSFSSSSSPGPSDLSAIVHEDVNIEAEKQFTKLIHPLKSTSASHNCRSC